MSTHLYVLQLNARLGDFEGNLARALEILNTRFEGFSTAEDPQGTARVVIFPQGAFSGLMPLAAYRWEDVQTREANALRELTRWVKAHGLTALVPMSARLYAIDPDGTVHPYELSGGSIAAGESVLVWGRAVQAVEAKRSIYVDFGRAERLLDAPTSEETAQDLARYFVGEPSKDALSANVGVLGTGCACGVATSLVGGYDTHVASGYMSTYCEEVFTHYPDFREGFLYALWNEGIFEEEDYEPLSPELPTESPLYTTLVVALRDYVRKNGFSKVVLGLSGGIDSALVTSLAVDALGAENVRVLFMRTGFTSETSEQGVREIVKNMGLTLHDFSFTELFDTTVGFLEKAYGVSLPWDVTEENIQARLRALFVMAFSNKFNELALCTSNKSEAAMGYGTLYGDITGGFAPLIDLWKGQIVELCRERNAEAQGEWIPELIITREPSAELRAGQKDSDALPPYDTIEEVLEVFLSTRSSAGITDVDPSLVESIIRRTLQNQFKRAQGIPGPVVSKTPLSLLGDFGLTYQSPKAR